MRKQDPKKEPVARSVLFFLPIQRYTDGNVRLQTSASDRCSDHSDPLALSGGPFFIVV